MKSRTAVSESSFLHFIEDVMFCYHPKVIFDMGGLIYLLVL